MMPSALGEETIPLFIITVGPKLKKQEIQVHFMMISEAKTFLKLV